MIETNRKHQVLLIGFTLSILSAAPHPTGAQEISPAYLNARTGIEERVNDLLARMTLEEKIAQLFGALDGQADTYNNGNVSFRREHR